MKKRWGVQCAVRWCVCLAKAKSQYCAVHATRGKDYHPGASEAGASAECDACEGSGKCEDCDGDGTHFCDHGNCNDRHECGSCDGTGQCSECGDPPADEDSFDARYIRFAFDAGWVPPVLIDYPWESA